MDCQFVNHLDRALTDQFIAGVRELSLRKLILSKEDGDVDTFAKVFNIALTEETASTFARQMQDETAADSIHHMKLRPFASAGED